VTPHDYLTARFTWHFRVTRLRTTQYNYPTLLLVFWDFTGDQPSPTDKPGDPSPRNEAQARHD